MCTIGSIKINGRIFIFKNRDKIHREEEIVERIKSCIFIKSKNSGRIAAGLNKHEVAFVRAEIVSAGVIKAIYENSFNPLSLKNNDQINVAEMIMPTFDQFKNAFEVISFIQKSNLNLEPSNVILTDKNRSFSLEVENQRIDIKEVFNTICKTNHFSQLDFGPQCYAEYPSSFERLKCANASITTISNINELKKMLSSHENVNPDFNVCRHYISSTISSFIINTNNKSVEYCKSSPCKGEYTPFQLE